MSQVAEIFIAKGIVAHVLDQRAAIGESMSFFEIIRTRVGESLAEQWLDIIFPKQVNDLFMGQHRISAASLCQANEQAEANQRPPKVEKSCHNASRPLVS